MFRLSLRSQPKSYAYKSTIELFSLSFVDSFLTPLSTIATSIRLSFRRVKTISIYTVRLYMPLAGVVTLPSGIFRVKVQLHLIITISKIFFKALSDISGQISSVDIIQITAGYISQNSFYVSRQKSQKYLRSRPILRFVPSGIRLLVISGIGYLPQLIASIA